MKIDYPSDPRLLREVGDLVFHESFRIGIFKTTDVGVSRAVGYTDEEQKIFPLLNKRSFYPWGYCAFFLKYCGVHIKKYKILVA
ncbi:hypothetical protein NIES4073_33670 [Kalymmatonema gypsitolerans NIES-4073]|nr:hypothetical protein NIES4073_33670 [Scytonema sp. NIES-4073]